MAIKDTEFLYASSNIRAIEGSESYSERLRRFSECKSVGELYSQLTGGETDSGASGDIKERIEKMLDDRLCSSVSLVMKIVPDKKLYNFLLYEYDCCNLKTAIKCAVMGISCEGRLYECGTVPADRIAKDVSEGRFDIFPKNMANAAGKAREAYEKTKDPSAIDMILDRACFEDMLENANEYGCEKFISLVKARIDRVNLMTFIRVAKSDISDRQKTLDEALVDGGTLSKGSLIGKLEGYDGNIEAVLSATPYHSALSMIGSDFSLSSLEKALDDVYLSLVKDMKLVSFGAEIPCAYLINTSYEIKNIRIILAGIASSLPQEKIRERVRFGYV